MAVMALRERDRIHVHMYVYHSLHLLYGGKLEVFCHAQEIEREREREREREKERESGKAKEAEREESGGECLPAKLPTSRWLHCLLQTAGHSPGRGSTGTGDISSEYAGIALSWRVTHTHTHTHTPHTHTHTSPATTATIASLLLAVAVNCRCH